jgi:hypothetical protein
MKGQISRVMMYKTMLLRSFLGITALFLLILSFFSCKKSSDASSKSKTTLATQSTWKIQSVGADLDKNGSVDYDATSQLQSCQTDNIYTLKSDGTGTADEGTTKCNSTDAQTSAIVWSFKSNETIFNGNLGIFSGDATISALNDANFVLWKDTTLSGTPMRMYVTLKH